jgi:hypothetical protein
VATYNPEREITPQFVARVTEWIAATGEVLVILRYLYGAGSRDYLFCRSSEDLHTLIDSLPEGADTIVFQHPQLPIRGISSDSFIDHCLTQIPAGSEYMIARLDSPLPPDRSVSGFDDDSHGDLRGHLEVFHGQAVAVGRCPNFIGPDCDTMISASKGGIDGPR